MGPHLPPSMNFIGPNGQRMAFRHDETKTQQKEHYQSEKNKKLLNQHDGCSQKNEAGVSHIGQDRLSSNESNASTNVNFPCSSNNGIHQTEQKHPNPSQKAT
jgi:hypothetical protein